MTKLNSIVLAVLTVFGIATGARAQEPAPAQAKGLVPLEIEVVITRYDGAKKISSLPYVLAVNANGTEVQLNMGTQVAVPNSAFTPIKEPKVEPIVSYSYRDVGTRISARARSGDSGFDIQLNIDDSSVFTSSVSGAPMPAFRSFSARNQLLLRDGQMREYTAATDRVSGEVVKISVALKVVK